ncbi:hypothetical protein DS891_04100 [Pseudoalteromonas sp. JC28]|nr:hypothetical protein [Pseudoalteromonas sp. JC28]
MKTVLFYTFWLIYLLSSLATLAMVFLDFGTVQADERELLINAFLVETAVAIFALFYSLFNLKNKKQQDSNHGVEKLQTRENYIQAQVTAIEKATKTIYFYISKLNIDSLSEDAKQINSALRHAASKNIKIQILVGATAERLQGAISLSNSANIEVGFDPALVLSDVTYLCIDSNVVIIGVKNNKNKNVKSNEWYTILSSTMVRSLVSIFEQNWNSPATLTLEQMLRTHLPSSIRASGEEAIAEKIGISVSQIAKYKDSKPFIILMLGRPGSGKTTVSTAMVSLLSSANIQAQHLTDIDFFYNIFNGEPSDLYEKTADGGYLVKNQELYTEATKEVAKNVIKDKQNYSFIIVELARSDYKNTTKTLIEEGVTPDLIVYLDVEYKEALARNLWRKDIDGLHFCSEDEMNATYKHDDIDSFESSADHNIVRIYNPHISKESGDILAKNIISVFRQSV